MNRLIRHKLLTAIVAAALTAVCAPQESESNQKMTAKSLQVQLASAKPTFEEDEPISLSVSVGNTSSDHVYVFNSLQEGLLLLFTIKDEKGIPVYKSPRTMMERNSAFLEDTVRLDPGYSLGRVLPLGDTPGSTLLKLPIGKYEVSAIYTNQDPQGKGGTIVGVFRSSPLNIQVVRTAREHK